MAEFSENELYEGAFDDVESLGDAVKKGAEVAGNAVKAGAKAAGNAVKKGAKAVKDKLSGGKKPSFEVDAGKIMAKLHRGACQAQKGFKFFNTGVLNDANIAPEAVDKSKMDFDLEQDVYEIGVIMKPEYKFALPEEFLVDTGRGGEAEITP